MWSRNLVICASKVNSTLGLICQQMVNQPQKVVTCKIYQISVIFAFHFEAKNHSRMSRSFLHSIVNHSLKTFTTALNIKAKYKCPLGHQWSHSVMHLGQKPFTFWAEIKILKLERGLKTQQLSIARRELSIKVNYLIRFTLECKFTRVRRSLASSLGSAHIN
jgi:hypothetical protein